MKDFGDAAVLKKLGKYEIRRELGKGVMGFVYEGFDPFFERAVIIKFLQKPKEDTAHAQEILARFRRKAQATGRLSHPNIVPIYEFGENTEVAYFAMEYIANTGLNVHLDKNSLFPLSDCIDLMSQLLDALEYAHTLNIVHGDIKPANILLTKDRRIKITDFGSARIESSAPAQDAIVYLSPEQLQGGTGDRRSDIYSSGVLLYQMLSGMAPFAGGDKPSTLHKIMNETPASLVKLNPAIPVALQGVAEKAIARRPEDRYQTAAEFLKVIQLAMKPKAAPAPAVVAAESIVMEVAPSPHEKASLESIVDFSMDDFEKRLEETREEVFRKGGMKEPEELDGVSLKEVKLNFDHAIPATQTQATPDISPAGEATSSNLLAGLAQEARGAQSAQQAALQDGQAKAKQIDETLKQLIKYFTPFIKHVNEMKPEIKRIYRYKTETAYANLKWQNAILDFRKQSLSDLALLDYFALTITLCAPHPLPIKRPWEPLENLQKELQNSRLRLADNTDLESIKRKQAWLEVQLAPDFPIQIRFQGNYQENLIDVTCRNLEAFGVTTYKLDPDDVVQAFIDNMGLYLLDRTDNLPEQLKRI